MTAVTITIKQLKDGVISLEGPVDLHLPSSQEIIKALGTRVQFVIRNLSVDPCETVKLLMGKGIRDSVFQTVKNINPGQMLKFVLQQQAEEEKIMTLYNLNNYRGVSVIARRVTGTAVACDLNLELMEEQKERLMELESQLESAFKRLRNHISTTKYYSGKNQDGDHDGDDDSIYVTYASFYDKFRGKLPAASAEHKLENDNNITITSLPTKSKKSQVGLNALSGVGCSASSSSSSSSSTALLVPDYSSHLIYRVKTMKP